MDAYRRICASIGGLVRGHLVVFLVGATIVLFAILTLGFGRGGVSGASVREWDRILPDRTSEYCGWQFGVPRTIRYDEWATSLPFVMAQCRSSEFFPRVNNSVNGGTDMFIQTPCAPVWDWTAFGQFHNWGYFLLGADNGLAWNWWSRFLLLPLFCFLFLMRWCNGDGLVALAGAAAVTLGAPTQWWDTTVPYHLTYLFATVVFLRQVFASRRRWVAALASFGLFVSLASYFFVMYPPFSILFLPVLAALAVFEIRGRNRAAGWFRILLSLIALAGVVVLLVYFFTVHADTIAIIRDSSYPGARFIRGGSFKFLCERLLADLMSFCSAFLHGHAGLNECEISEYIGLAIPLFAGLVVSAKRRRFRFDWMVVGLFAYALVMYAWCMCAWPECLARWTGLFLIPPRRAAVVGGFAVLVAALRWFAIRGNGSDNIPGWTLYALAVGYLGLRCIAFCEHGEISGWFRASWINMAFLAVGLSLSSLTVFGLFARRRIIFAFSLIAFSVLTGCFVHPLSEGLSPIYDKRLSEAILEIDAANPGVWAANDRVVAQLPMALGLKAYTGTQQYCDKPFWSAVVPDSRRRSVWNRYGHRYITDLKGKGVLENRKRLDAMFFSLDEDAVRRLGIRYVIWRGKTPDIPWLRHLKTVRSDRIYEVVNGD